ncbi:MAG: V-type ATP synthase subunit D [Porticoccus sp.]
MSKLRFNKSELRRISQDLDTYHQFLPALKLRRSQLLEVKGQLHSDLREGEQRLNTHRQSMTSQLSMMGCAKLHINRMLKVSDLQISWENVAGIALPTLERVDFDLIDYDFFTTPDWLEFALGCARKLVETQLQLKTLAERGRLLGIAITKTTQRINLFETVLIPDAEEDCRKIKIYLSDEATGAVVRSKLAKAQLVKKVRERVF